VDPYKEKVKDNPILEVRETPLHLAIKTGSPKTVRQLLRAGADPFILWRKGEATQTVWELCTGQVMVPAQKQEAIIVALARTWTPERHRSFQASFKVAVGTTLLCANREQWPFPKEVIFLILWHLALVWPPPKVKSLLNQEVSRIAQETVTLHEYKINK